MPFHVVRSKMLQLMHGKSLARAQHLVECMPTPQRTRCLPMQAETSISPCHCRASSPTQPCCKRFTQHFCTRLRDSLKRVDCFALHWFAWFWMKMKQTQPRRQTRQKKTVPHKESEGYCLRPERRAAPTWPWLQKRSTGRQCRTRCYRA